MPRPQKGETKQEYVSRFMSSEEAKSDFPDEKQRLAVAYSMWERKNSIYNEDVWPKQYSCSFIEPGVVFYQDLGDNGETVLVKQEALSKMAKTFVGKPVINKTHKDVVASTVANGEADGIVTDVWYDDKTGWWMCKFIVWDAATQKNCESPAYSVSCAYEPTDVDSTGGSYHNLPFQEEIKDGKYTHLAIVTNPRYEGARIFVNSKGGVMSWKFWPFGARKNAAPLDPKRTLVNVDGKSVPLQELYDAAKEDEPKTLEMADDGVIEIDGKEHKLGDLKAAYAAKNRKAHMEGRENDEHVGEPTPLPDLRDSAPGSGASPAKPAEEAERKNAEAASLKADLLESFGPEFAKESVSPTVSAAIAYLAGLEGSKPEALLSELKHAAEEKALEKKNAEEAEKKAAEEKKNAEEKAAEEKKNAEEKAAEEARKNAEEKEKEERRNAGRKAFADLRNSAHERSGVPVTPSLVTQDERLARGREKYGSAA